MSSDDDSELSTSSREYLESPAKAKREALRRKLEKAGMRGDAKSEEAALKQLKLSVLQSEVNANNDDKHNRGAQSSFGTKTREEQIAASKMSGQTTLSIDQLVEQGNLQQKTEQALRQDEVQTEDA